MHDNDAKGTMYFLQNIIIIKINIKRIQNINYYFLFKAKIRNFV